jgi:hypothetical protein
VDVPLRQYPNVLTAHSSQHGHTAQLMLGGELSNEWLV